MASYGPEIPPEHSSRKSQENDDDDDDDDDVICPTMPPARSYLSQTSSSENSDDDDVIGPALPPHLQKKRTPKEAKKEEEKGDEFGVQLPPDYSRWNTFDVDASDNDFGEDDDDDDVDAGLGKPNEEEEEDDDSYGPALPPGFKKNQPVDNVETSDTNVKNYGPSLPPPGSHSNMIAAVHPEDEESEEEEEEMIGPMPVKPGSEGLYALSAAEEFERRSSAMKEKLAAKDRPEQVTREAWMMELPGYSTNFGLGSRSFRKTPRPEETDRSEWTDTPADKARKEKERADKRRMEERTAGKSKKDDDQKELSQRDKRLADMVAKHNDTKRAESLVDMHTKDRKRKLEEEGDKPVERRPFDRDLDLNVNQFDEAKRKLLIKKSAQLNDKFSHGKDKVYL